MTAYLPGVQTLPGVLGIARFIAYVQDLTRLLSLHRKEWPPLVLQNGTQHCVDIAILLLQIEYSYFYYDAYTTRRYNIM